MLIPRLGVLDEEKMWEMEWWIRFELEVETVGRGSR